MARKQQTITIDYQPQERQKLLHLSQARQILYGGAAGGGKSHAIRWDGIMFACQNPGFVGVLIRRSRAELIKNHIQQVMELPEVIGRYSHDRNCYEFFNGSKLYMEYCERDADLLRHQGAEYHWIGIDEAALVEEHHLHFLKSRLRLGGWKPANEADARRLPRFVMASNPGGPAHNYLKHTFMDHGIKPETYFYDKEMRNPRDPEDKGWVSIFIPARIADNKYIDAGYDAAFSGLPPEQQRAFRDGDWDAIVGKAIHNLDREKHLIRPFEPPRHWTHFMSIDWGSHRPYSIGWYTVSEGALLKGKDGYRDVWLPPGAVIRYKELYGWNGKANQGARTPAPEVAKRIIQKEADGPIMDYRVADSEMWADRGQPSIVDWFRKVDDRLIFRKSKKDRKRNYAEMIARLSGNADYMKDGQDADYPMFYVTQNCQHFWRTVPNLILDSNDPEKGPDTLKQEDHCYDECVYGLRSRPFVTTELDAFTLEREEQMRGLNLTGGDPYATA